MSGDISWEYENQNYLIKSIGKIKRALEKKINKSAPSTEVIEEELSIDSDILPSIEQICLTFSLSTFERDILLFCAGMELDPCFPSLCALAHADEQRNYPTFSLALEICENTHWSAFLPSAPLRRWQLVEIGTSTALTLSPLKINERILHCLAGLQHLDEKLSQILEPVPEMEVMVESHRKIAYDLAQTCEIAVLSRNTPIIQITGDSLLSQRGIAYQTSEQMGLTLYLLKVSSLPSNIIDLNHFLRLWERESILSGSALLLEIDDYDLSAEKTVLLNQLAEKVSSPLIINSRDRIALEKRSLINIDVFKPTAKEQTQLWQDILSDYSAQQFNGYVDKLVCQFNLNALEIESACTTTFSNAPEDPEDVNDSLWDSCRIQARPRMESLAQRIDPKAAWEDLILPPAQTDTLRAIVAHVKQRAKVYETWGFAKKSDRGLGISALFSGPSGTGKTTAAEVLAKQLNLDLYRIDLSSVVSKYIGETEKNLRRLFDAAEAGGAILFFDEADALFGKRSEVKDSHDRHANIEVSYLLQRMESYCGVAILATNFKHSLDKAFWRRLRFVIQFPFPAVPQRQQLWQCAFPPEAPVAELDYGHLARFNLTGGSVHTVALNAAFMAAAAGTPVTMPLLLEAIRTEYDKLERPINEAEFSLAPSPDSATASESLTASGSDSPAPSRPLSL